MTKFGNLSDEAIDQKIDGYNDAISELSEQIENINKLIRRIALKRDPLVEEKRNRNKDSLGVILNDPGAFRQWKAILPSQTYGSGFYHGGGEAPEQQAFKLMFKRGDKPCEELIAFIEKWLPLSHYKRMGIFRYDCGARGHWVLYFIDGYWVINEGYTLREWSIEYKSDNLVDALQYVSDNHWYED